MAFLHDGRRLAFRTPDFLPETARDAGELLVHELVRDDPVLLPSRSTAALENHHADSPEEASGRPADEPHRDDPPY